MILKLSFDYICNSSFLLKSYFMSKQFINLKIALVSAFVFFLIPVCGQIEYDFGFVQNDSIEVLDSNGIPMEYAWVGGLNSVHFQEIDLDIDGKSDLIIFDVHGDKLYPFINDGDSGEIKYKFSPEYAKLFPKMSGWVQCVDYDGDGKKDLYTYIPGGIALYKNTSSVSGGLAFQLISPMINFNSSSGFPVNIFVTAVDYPAIADIDFDGDIDILAFHILGTFVVYYKNMSMEIYGDKTHINYKEEDKCWGKFAESEEINSIYLNTFCNYKNAIDDDAKATKHTGSTMLAINFNGDSLMDLLLGDVDFFNLNALINGGNRDTALIVSQDTMFPSYDTTIHIVSFPVASYIDIDNDGVKELFASPFESSYYKPEALNSVWYFENSGTNDNPVFHFQKGDFMQDQMIEVGDNAMPEVVDVDGDGLKDIVITSYGIVDSTYFDLTWFLLYTHKSSTMTWYKNIGTVSAPKFQYMNGNLFDILSLKLTAAKAAFGDIDGDGDQDMLLGSENGRLLFYKNTASSGNMMTFASPIAFFDSIDVGEFSAPELFDINGDSLLDLVIGNKTGFLSYYQNVGTKSNPKFMYVTDTMGGVRVTNYWNYYTGYSVPEIYKDDKDSLVMMVGSASGKVFYYKNIASNITGHFAIDSNLLYLDYIDTISTMTIDTFYSVAYFINSGNVLEYIGVGMRSTPAVYDFNNDGFKDMILGNFSGGLNYFKGTTPASVGIKEREIPKTNFTIYPNPADNYIIIKFQNPELIEKAHISLYTIEGKIVAERLLTGDSNPMLVFDYLPTGVYLVGIETIDKSGKKHYGYSKVMIVKK